MNKNIAQEIEKGPDQNWRIKYDWHPGILPWNLVTDDHVYLDSAYSFIHFHSELTDGLKIGFASGNYVHSHIHTGRKGKIRIGSYVILEATNLISNTKITIGDHCMFSWGSVVTDSWIDSSLHSSSARKQILTDLAKTPNRFPTFRNSKPVIIEENVWVGFDAVILPGVRLGRGCIIGCKTVISEDVEPYSVVAGNPARVIRILESMNKSE